MSVIRSSVLKTLSPGAEDEVSNEKQFMAMLEAMGQSFLQPDINVFKLNLETLQMLNTKWKLYHKVSANSKSREGLEECGKATNAY